MEAATLLIALVAAVLAGAVGWLVGARRALPTLERVAGAEAALAAERGQADRHEAWLEERFATVSSKAMEASTRQLAELTEITLRRTAEAAKGDLAQRQQSVEALVAPLRDKLAEVDGYLRAVERDRVSAYSGLRAQVQEFSRMSEGLRTETAALVTALRAPQTRGRWGEIQLRRVVELAGMVEHCDFAEQQSVRTEDGLRRPDMVVRLAGGRTVVVDSKAPFAAYLEAMEARDEPTREVRRRAHARHFVEHVKALSAKAYWGQFEDTPEFVVMFVPADAFLDAALQEEPGLLEAAFAANVVLATPSTLVALLRTIAHTWRQESLAANAAQIQTLGRELYDRLGKVGSHLDKLGRSLGGAVASYNETIGSIESRVLVSARRLRELKLADAELPPLEPLTAQLRPLAAAELLDDVPSTIISMTQRAGSAEAAGRANAG